MILSPFILGIYPIPGQVLLLVGLGTLFPKQFWTHTLIRLASLDLLLQILNSYHLSAGDNPTDQTFVLLITISIQEPS